MIAIFMRFCQSAGPDRNQHDDVGGTLFEDVAEGVARDPDAR